LSLDPLKTKAVKGEQTMVTQISPPKKRQSKNGTKSQASDATHYKTRQDWPLDMDAAYQRERGPYTIFNATTLVGEEALEIFNGWLVWQAMTDAEERRIAATIQEILSLAARAIGFGQAYPDQFECVMINKDVYKPDVCVISKERYASQVEPIEPEGKHLVLKGSPELVVEIRSPSNRRTKERKKRKNYFESGALVIWDVDYEERKIWVYEVANPDTGQEYSEKDEISCEPILGKWKRQVADFFSKDLSAEQIVGQAAKEWRAESRVEGEVTAIHKVLLLQASVRFGEELPDNVTARLKRCGLEELMALASLLATVDSLAEWLKELPE
jgi:Uma2 family endonuclease